MPPRFKKSVAITLKPIKSDSKIDFVLEVAGVWDFNRDLAVVNHASGVPVDGTGIELNYSARGGAVTFHAAFQEMLANRIFNSCSHLFETVKLSKLDCSPDCEQSYQNLRSDLTADERAIAEKQLEELEQKAQELKKKLGK